MSHNLELFITIFDISLGVPFCFNCGYNDNGTDQDYRGTQTKIELTKIIVAPNVFGEIESVMRTSRA